MEVRPHALDDHNPLDPIEVCFVVRTSSATASRPRVRGTNERRQSPGAMVQEEHLWGIDSYHRSDLLFLYRFLAQLPQQLPREGSFHRQPWFWSCPSFPVLVSLFASHILNLFLGRTRVRSQCLPVSHADIAVTRASSTLPLEALLPWYRGGCHGLPGPPSPSTSRGPATPHGRCSRHGQGGLSMPWRTCPAHLCMSWGVPSRNAGPSQVSIPPPIFCFCFFFFPSLPLFLSYFLLSDYFC